MADAGPDDTTRLVTIFLGANDASLEEENPGQHVSRKLMLQMLATSSLAYRNELNHAISRKKTNFMIFMYIE